MSESSTFTPQTLADLNNALTSLNFRPIDKPRLDEILSTESRNRLVEAINKACKDSRAFAYLKHWFDYSGEQKVESYNQQSNIEQQYLDQQEQTSYPDTDDRPTGKDRTFIKKHVYGGRAALCFEADETRGGVHTMRLEAADSTAPKQYSWNDKIAIQLTRDELLIVTAVLFGMLPRCEYSNHGPDNSKGFSIEDQGNKLFVKVLAKGKKVKAVPMTPEDAFYVAQIFLGQLKKNAPWLEAGEIMTTLQRVVAVRKDTRQTR